MVFGAQKENSRVVEMWWSRWLVGLSGGRVEMKARKKG